MKEYSKVIRFLIYALGLCIGWFLLYDLWLSRFDDWLTLSIVDASVVTLQLLGYHAEAKNIFVRIDGFDTVFVNDACNGMIIMALFAGFIIAFPGSLAKKFFFIPAGIIVIHILNVLRVSALALNAYHFNQSVEFNHKYTFTIIVYAAVFALWMLWVKKYSGLKQHASSEAI
ncbi:exosortase X [uncultured Pontibacter sp.]|uniref:exosortase X n=1 Tax=uncultured Pontibacter sp. TaxID=453356 RepID=UPI002603E503|nr:archaeosortase/exosortase family protein [uncultured Pontibacter sp.]